jgi:phage terminase large subunit-like protein
MFAAIIAFFMVLEQGYADPESYFAASGAKQAGILLRYCKSVAKNSLNVRIRSERQVYQIKYYNDGKSEAVANKTGGELDGLKPLIAVLDECHALPDNALRSAFTRGMGWSMDTLFMSISTAGINVMNYFYKQVTHGKLILSTNTAHVDDKTQYFLFTLDDGDLERDDLSTNEDLWYKANPNLGVTPPLQGFRDDIEKAWLMDEDRAEFCVKNFNVFNTGMDAEKLFSTTDYNRNIEEFNIEDFYGCELYLGFDLAPKIDLTAIGAVVKKDGIYYAWSDLYVAGTKDALVRKGTKVNFADHKEWININWHGVTPDYQAIRDRFQFYKDNFQIQGVGFDPAFSGTLMQDVELMGIDVIPVKQYHVAYNEVVIMMENALAEDKLKFDGNIIQRYCFYNAMKDENKHGMRMVGKRESKLMGDAVDATVAIMTAFNIYIGQNIEHSAIAEYYNRIING